MESKNLKKRSSYTSAGNIYLMKKILSFLAVDTILERLLSEYVSYYSGYTIILCQLLRSMKILNKFNHLDLLFPMVVIEK